MSDERSRGQVTASPRPFLRHKKTAHIDVLELQQLHFFVDSARVACQIPARADYAMAGDNYRDLIAAHRPADRLRRHFRQSALFSKPPRKVAVSNGMPVGYLQKQLPHRHAKISTYGVQRRREIRLSAREINIKPAFCLRKRVRFPLGMLGGQVIGKVFFALKPTPPLVPARPPRAKYRPAANRNAECTSCFTPRISFFSIIA